MTNKYLIPINANDCKRRQTGKVPEYYLFYTYFLNFISADKEFFLDQT